MDYVFYSKEQVRSKYIAKGSFYRIEHGAQKGYRNDLHILDKDLKSSAIDLAYNKPDILFIMMNPGSSHPVGNHFHYITKDNAVEWLLNDNLVDAEPDETQD